MFSVLLTSILRYSWKELEIKYRSHGSEKSWKIKWGLSQYPNASNFITYQFDHAGNVYEKEAKGRYYSIKKEELAKIYVDKLT